MTAAPEHRPVISGGLPSKLPGTGPDEASEWAESLRGMAEAQGQYRARYVLLKLL
jgi:pyruvate dehydrogenase complex dehydrogenase (E1) component